MAFIGNFIENEDNLPNGNAFRGEDWRDIRENAIRDEIVMEPSQIFSYISIYDDLELVKNMLYVGLHQLFDEFEITIAKCPCLTRPPYNLAAVGLSGNTKMLLLGNELNLIPEINRSSYNFGHLLLNYCYDFFVIGASYAATPSMPCSGHLTINAMISPSRNVINNSCIVYEEAGRRILVTVNNPNQIRCSIMGNLFLSEGREGLVLKVRAKGRRTNIDIISLIQNCLSNYCSHLAALGGVLMINGGRVKQHIIPENYPRGFVTLEEFNEWLKCYELNCRNLIMIGALLIIPASLIDNQHTIDCRYKFNSFSDYEAAGQFINDVTPNETEYIALGGVLMINGGRVIQHVTPENYPKKFATLRECKKWLKCYELNCNNLIIIGALADFSTVSANLIDKHRNIQVTNSPYKFHSFSGEAVGQFINDITPNETEYIGYFNIAYEKLVGTNL